MKRLEKKIIVVAGAGGGIGGAIARRFVEESATVVLAGRRNRSIGALLAELQRTNPECAAVQNDFTDYVAWRDLVDSTLRQFGRIDAVVHSIGVLNPKDLIEQQADEISLQIASNLTSLVYAAKAILPVMLRRGSGHLIAVGSLAGVVPVPHASLYSSTKYAVRGFCFSLHEELRGTGISVSLVSPGPVQTKMLELEARNSAIVASFINKPLCVDRVAEAVLRLLLKPRREVVLPALVGYLSIVSNAVPGIFTLLSKLLEPIGRRRHDSYRRRYCNPTTLPMENLHVNPN